MWTRAVVETLDCHATTLYRSRRQIVGEAIRLYSEAVEQRPDSFEAAFGARRWSESPEQLHRQLRTPVGDSMRRHER